MSTAIYDQSSLLLYLNSPDIPGQVGLIVADIYIDYNVPLNAYSSQKVLVSFGGETYRIIRLPAPP